MKKSVTLVEAHIHDEPEETYRKHTTAKPKLSYGCAMSSYFVIQGEIYQVRSCKPEAIRALVEVCIETTKRPDLCKMDLAGLDYGELISRWFALETLQTRGAALPLYESREEAEKALIAHNMGIQWQSIAV